MVAITPALIATGQCRRAANRACRRRFMRAPLIESRGHTAQRGLPRCAEFLGRALDRGRGAGLIYPRVGSADLIGLAPTGSDASAARRWRRGEGERCRTLLMQHRADLTEIFRSCRRKRVRSALEAGEWPGALGERQRMVMPAEQEGLKQD